MKLYLGIDLGGTNTKLGLVDALGAVIRSTSIETRVDLGPQSWIDRIHAATSAWSESFEWIGVGSPGPLDTRTGTILVTPNLKSFEGFSMKAALSQKFQKPVAFENDANCAALAEFHFGFRKGTPDLVSITLGTGVGSGVIVGGRLLRGSKGFACELGHMAIHRSDRPEDLFDRGSLESFVGAGRSMKSFSKIHPTFDTSVPIKEHFEQAAKGDALSVSFVDGWVQALGVGIYNVLVLFNPSAVILSGGVSASWSMVQTKLFDFLQRSSYPQILEGTHIELSRLGENFGVQGAVAAAWDKLGSPS